MKKWFAVRLASLLLLFAVAPSAQAKIFKWGIEAGANFSKMKLSKDIVDSDNRTGWFAGVKGQITLPIVGLGVDGALLYSQKYMAVETTKTATNPDTGEEISYPLSENKRMPYVEIPVNVRYTFGLSRVVGLYVATGPQWSWYMGSKTLFDGKSVGSLNESNFSWNVGAGANLFSHLQIGVSYNIAVGNTGEVKDRALSENIGKITLKNNTWQVRLAYFF